MWPFFLGTKRILCGARLESAAARRASARLQNKLAGPVAVVAVPEEDSTRRPQRRPRWGASLIKRSSLIKRTILLGDRGQLGGGGEEATSRVMMSPCMGGGRAGVVRGAKVSYKMRSRSMSS